MSTITSDCHFFADFFIVSVFWAGLAMQHPPCVLNRPLFFPYPSAVVKLLRRRCRAQKDRSVNRSRILGLPNCATLGSTDEPKLLGHYDSRRAPGLVRISAKR